MTYYYVDFMKAGEVVIDLADSGVIYNLEAFEQLGANFTFKQSGDKITVTSDGKGYIMLKASRALEVESAFMKNSTTGVRFVNYSDSAKTVDITIASYVGGKLADVKMVKDVTIGANAIVNKELNVSVAEGTEYKIFVLDSESGIVPVAKNANVEIR